MENIKIDQALQLALKLPEEKRAESAFLNFGFENEADSLQIIVRHTGNLQAVKDSIPGIRLTELLNGYAIIRIKPDQIEQIASFSQITYIEKPKRLFFSLQDSRSASCLTGIQKACFSTNVDELYICSDSMLSGFGTLIGIIDSGIDFRHPAFIDQNGESRIAYLWDQTADRSVSSGRIPTGFDFGAQYMKDTITAAISNPDLIPFPETGTGHGTAVAGIAAGNGNGSPGYRYRGVATECELIVVRLGRKTEDFAGTTEVMMGVDYAVRKAIQENKPLAINLSFGTNEGSHGGQSLFETYLSDLIGTWKTAVIAASGNEGDARHHSRIFLDDTPNQVEISIGPGEKSLSLQIWKNYADQFRLTLKTPDGALLSFPEDTGIPFHYQTDFGDIYYYYGTPTPFTITQPVYIEWISAPPERIEPGIWTLTFLPERIITGIVDLWLPTIEAVGRSTGFLTPDPDITLTLPSTARNVITVGAYRTDTNSIAAFSGRGNTEDGRVKPTLVAPGVNIMTTLPENRYGRMTGTSIAAPFVTGSAALLMEWGIIRENDPYLYGEKLKSYLIRGARKLPEQTKIPDTAAGFGSLCVRNSLPL